MFTRSLLFLLIFSLLFLGKSSLSLDPVKALAAPYFYSLVEWEVVNFPGKWLQRVQGLLRRPPPPQEQLAQLILYLRLGEEIRELEGDTRRHAALAPRHAAEVESLQRRLQEKIEARERLRNQVEEFLEAQISSLLVQEGLASRWGPFKVLFPPVDFRLGKPPKVLVTSPRDRIEMRHQLLLDPHLELKAMEQLEGEVLVTQNLSALVAETGGVATYPSVIPHTPSLYQLLSAAAHEWLHQYLFFHPLGQNYRSSPQMTTLNETLADLVGEEVAERVLRRLGFQPPHPSTSEEEGETKAFDFNREMRKTRVRVEELLKEGKIREAEAYMEAQRRLFVAQGYYIRKLNQAYFAFYGNYADNPASTSPIARELDELRRLSPSLGHLVRTLAGVSSYPQFQELLHQARARQQLP